MRLTTLLGRTSNNFPWRSLVDVYDQERFSHTLVLGMTGSGKTTTLFNIIAQDLKKRSVLIVDGKGDIDIVGPLKKKFDFITFGEKVKGNCYFNPLIGPVDQAVNNFFEATYDQFESAYYKGFAESLLKGYLILCSTRGEGRNVPTLSELQKICVSIKDFTDEIGEKFHIEYIKNAFGTLLEMRPDQYRLVHSGLYNIIHNLIQSSWRDCLEGTGAFQGLPQLDLDLLHQQRKNLYIGLQKLANTQGTKIVGRLLLARLSNIIALRATIDPFDLAELPEISCVVDEVAGLAFPVISNIVQVARSSRVMMTLSTQTLGDLDNVSPEFTQQIESNTGVKIIHRLNSSDDTDRIVKYFGTTEVIDSKLFDRVAAFFEKQSLQQERLKALSVFKVDPDRIKELPNGVAIVSARREHGSDKSIQETQILNFKKVISEKEKKQPKEVKIDD